MQIIRKKILINSNLVTKIQINSDLTQYGDDQGNNVLSDLKASEVVNPIIDSELIRYKYEDTKTETDVAIMHQLSFSFNQKDIYTFPPAFSNMFTNMEISGNTKNFQNSFFILEFFDSSDVYNQKKLSTTYLTKKSSSGLAIYVLNNYDSYVPTMPINQANSIFIPEYFVNSVSGNTVNCYCRMMFYNAKSGQTITFFNNMNINAIDSSKLFFDVEINKSNKTWKFINQKYLAGTTPLVAIVGIEPNKDNLYNKRVNDGVENIENNVENYPTGNTFNYMGINYI